LVIISSQDMKKFDNHRQTVSPYITAEGWQRLSDELAFLWRTKRPQVVQAVADAAALGDRSENAEYIYGKKQLRQIDARIRFLRKRLAELKVVDRVPNDTSRIFFGAWVVLESADGKIHRYRIVGADEFDPAKNFISVDSPMARALLRRAEGDEVSVKRPNGDDIFVVVGISY